MASVSTDKVTGLQRIIFYDLAGKRKSIRLGRLPQTTAETIQGYIEDILKAQLAGESVRS
jgi:hypothetical protein